MGANRISILRNVRWGLRCGAVGAFAFSAIAAIPALLRSMKSDGDHDLPPFALMVLVYAFGGFAGGLIIGLLRPALSYWWARRMVGVVAAVPVAFAVAASMEGWVFVQENVASVLQFAAIWGLVMSFAVEEDPLGPLRRFLKY